MAQGNEMGGIYAYLHQPQHLPTLSESSCSLHLVPQNTKEGMYTNDAMIEEWEDIKTKKVIKHF
jgi:hypothetical protein